MLIVSVHIRQQKKNVNDGNISLVSFCRIGILQAILEYFVYLLNVKAITSSRLFCRLMTSTQIRTLLIWTIYHTMIVLYWARSTRNAHCWTSFAIEELLDYYIVHYYNLELDTDSNCKYFYHVVLDERGLFNKYVEKCCHIFNIHWKLTFSLQFVNKHIINMYTKFQ
jgi:hypothetical protein